MKLSNTFKCATFYSTLLSNYLFANTFLDYFTQANVACESYLNGRSNDWDSPVNLFTQGFNDMNNKLQAIWRGLVGDGETKKAWNGIPNGSQIEDKFIKTDCPIVLHTWLTNHVLNYQDSSGIYLYDAEDFVPLNFPKQKFSNCKRNYKKHVLKLFNKQSLKDCAFWINQNFCQPVSKLIQSISKISLTQKQLHDIGCLYSCYNRLDTGFPINAISGHKITQDAITECFVNFYLNFSDYDEQTQNWLKKLLINYNKNPYSESAGITQYNIDLTLFLRELSLKIKTQTKVIDPNFLTLLSSIKEEWNKVEKYFENQENRNEEVLTAIRIKNALIN